MTRQLNWVLCVCASLFVVLTGMSDGNAQSPDVIQQVQGHFDAGVEHYESEAFEEAIGEFEAGYALVPDPIFLYNISLAHGKLGRVDRSRTVAELAHSVGLEDPDRTRNLARIKALAAAQSSQSTATQMSRVTQIADPTPVPVDTSTALFTPIGWIGVGAVGAGFVGIVVAFLLDSSLSDDITEFEDAASRADAQSYEALKSDIEGTQTGAGILYIAGSALTLTGAGLIAWDLLTREESETQVSAGLSVGSEGPIVSVFGRW